MAHCWQGCCVSMEHHSVMEGAPASAARTFCQCLTGMLEEAVGTMQKLSWEPGVVLWEGKAGQGRETWL